MNILQGLVELKDGRKGIQATTTGVVNLEFIRSLSSTGVLTTGADPIGIYRREFIDRYASRCEYCGRRSSEFSETCNGCGAPL